MRIMLPVSQVVYSLLIAHPPMDVLPIVGKYLRQCGSPAAVTYYAYLS